MEARRRAVTSEEPGRYRVASVSSRNRLGAASVGGPDDGLSPDGCTNVWPFSSNTTRARVVLRSSWMVRTWDAYPTASTSMAKTEPRTRSKTARSGRTKNAVVIFPETVFKRCSMSSSGQKVTTA